jgi:hypothetical protein
MTFDKREIARYLGVRGGAYDAELSVRIDEAVAAAEKIFAPDYFYKIYGIAETPEGLSLTGSALTLTGAVIAKHLTGCSRAAVLCATLGFGADRELIRLQKTEVARALLLDAAATAALESVCDGAETDIIKRVGGALAPRFSPGYGDLPVSLNRGILTALDAGRRLGVTLGAGGMMSPCKTVTAVIGIRN